MANSNYGQNPNYGPSRFLLETLEANYRAVKADPSLAALFENGDDSASWEREIAEARAALEKAGR